jgi:hypothetical protein
MTQEKLRDNFEGATDSLIKLTREFCTNELSGNYRYILKPNQEAVDSHLDEKEISFLKQILKYRNVRLTKKEVTDLIWSDDKVPLWINTSVIASTDSLTTIELLISRRLRGDNDLNHKADKFPPFHLQVSLPPGYKDGDKFDINWRTNRVER